MTEWYGQQAARSYIASRGARSEDEQGGAMRRRVGINKVGKGNMERYY